MTTTTHPSAAERLAAALHPSGFVVITDADTGEEVVRFPTVDMARSILAADPTLSQDIEDGTALRLLREACDRAEPYRAWFTVEYAWAMTWHWTVRVERHIKDGDDEMSFRADTIAAAAKACRDALEGAK